MRSDCLNISTNGKFTLYGDEGWVVRGMGMMRTVQLY